jgi:hypothetical protein
VRDISESRDIVSPVRHLLSTRWYSRNAAENGVLHKHLNKAGVHTNACFKAIPDGVCKRLAKLTTLTEENKDKKLDGIYPMHFKALKHAGLMTEKVPTLDEELQ